MWRMLKPDDVIVLNEGQKKEVDTLVTAIDRELADCRRGYCEYEAVRERREASDYAYKFCVVAEVCRQYKEAGWEVSASVREGAYTIYVAHPLLAKGLAALGIAALSDKDAR
jgi:hypothetical protein